MIFNFGSRILDFGFKKYFKAKGLRELQSPLLISKYY